MMPLTRVFGGRHLALTVADAGGRDGPDQLRAIMDGDPAVQADILSHTVHSCRSFPG